jgi:hypothetical protein
MTTPADFYGVEAVTVTEQIDQLTLTGSATALTKTGIVSVPGQETAGAAPTSDVISVYDVTTSKALVLNTDYALTPTGAAPETQGYTIARISSSPNSGSGDTIRVTYRWGTIPDTSFNAGEFQGNAGPVPAGTASQASTFDSEGASASGLGSAAGYGSLTDPAAGTQSSSETGAPGSEYAVTETTPGAYGSPLGSPDTEGTYGGQLPENFSPTDTSLTGVLDTQVGAGGVLTPGLGAPPAYRAPSSGVAGGVKDTTLTEILGNQLNANPLAGMSENWISGNLDTEYSGAPSAPGPLLTQTDAFTSVQPGTPVYLTKQGVVPSSIVVKDTTGSTTLVLGTDYAVTTAGNGATTACYLTLTAGTNFTAGHAVSVGYSYGDATYYDSNMPASVPAAPSITAATAVNRGAQITWSPPAGQVPIDSYELMAEDGGTLFVPASGQPVFDGQPSPGGGATAGQPAYQADTLILGSAALSPPSAPSPTTAATGGTVAAGTYKVAVTYVNANGETVASSQGTVTTTGATSTISAPSPAAETGATGWYAYVSQAGGSSLTRQQATPTAIGTALTITVPPTSSGAAAPTQDTSAPTTSRSGIITPPGQIIVRDLTSVENDPTQPDGQVLEQGYDYQVIQTGTGPWARYQIELLPGSVNAQAGDQIVVEYWWGADPSSLTAIFTQGLLPNTPVIYKPDGTTYSQHGYRFKVAARNRAGLGPYSPWSSYVVPLNFNEPQPGHEGATQNELALDPANTINPIYLPNGTVKAGTGLGG